MLSFVLKTPAFLDIVKIISLSLKQSWALKRIVMSADIDLLIRFVALSHLAFRKSSVKEREKEHQVRQ